MFVEIYISFETNYFISTIPITLPFSFPRLVFPSLTPRLPTPPRQNTHGTDLESRVLFAPHSSFRSGPTGKIELKMGFLDTQVGTGALRCGLLVCVCKHWGGGKNREPQTKNPTPRGKIERIEPEDPGGERI